MSTKPFMSVSRRRKISFTAMTRCGLMGPRTMRIHSSRSMSPLPSRSMSCSSSKTSSGEAPTPISRKPIWSSRASRRPSLRPPETRKRRTRASSASPPARRFSATRRRSRSAKARSECRMRCSSPRRRSSSRGSAPAAACRCCRRPLLARGRIRSSKSSASTPPRWPRPAPPRPGRSGRTRQSLHTMEAKLSSSPGIMADMATCAAAKSAAVTAESPFHRRKSSRMASSMERRPTFTAGCSCATQRRRNAAWETRPSPSPSRASKTAYTAWRRLSLSGPCKVATMASALATPPSGAAARSVAFN
mmetsp:Transcript_129771/g.289474  ORF Transcript_129771/g.289474 Transcript_129771/m.289474 type:complete len:304 (+) Transcript_129771:364-1275(+)